VALALTLGATAAAPGVAAAANQVEVHRLQLAATPTPFGWANLTAVAVGDVDGDGRPELVLSWPAANPASAPTEDRPAPFRVELLRLEAGSGEATSLSIKPVAALGPYQLTLNKLVVADMYPVRPAEIWFAYLPQVAALEWDGTAYQALNGWQTWANKPVVLSRYGPRAQGTEELLAFAYYYSPEVAVGLVTVNRPIRCPSKHQDVQSAAFFSPKDRFVAADLDGDGREELVAAYSRLDQQFPPRPLTVSDLWTGRERATVSDLNADGVAVGDVDGDGRPEVAAYENRLGSEGWPQEGIVRVFRWNDGRLAEVKRFSYPGALVGDLTIATVRDPTQDDLLVALVERSDSHSVTLKLVLPYR
jgi:hypothetical protein